MNDTTEHHGSNPLNAPSPSNSQSNDLLNLLDSLYPKGSFRGAKISRSSKESRRVEKYPNRNRKAATRKKVWTSDADSKKPNRE